MTITLAVSGFLTRYGVSHAQFARDSGRIVYSVKHNGTWKSISELPESLQNVVRWRLADYSKLILAS